MYECTCPRCYSNEHNDGVFEDGHCPHCDAELSYGVVEITDEFGNTDADVDFYTLYCQICKVRFIGVP